MKCILIKKMMLKRRISREKLAVLTGIPSVALLIKLWGVVEFRAWEILNISKALELDKNEIGEIFLGKSFLKETKQRKRVDKDGNLSS